MNVELFEAAVRHLAYIPAVSEASMKSVFRSVCSFGVVAALLAALALPAHAQSTLADLQSNLVGSWLAKIDGEARSRTLVITAVANKGVGTFDLIASYGYSDGSISSLREAEVRQSGKDVRLRILSSADSVIVATWRSDFTFDGTITFKNGRVKRIKFEMAAPAAAASGPVADYQSTPTEDVAGARLKWREILDQAPPTSGTAQSLGKAYLKRIDAARALGESERELAEVQAALQLIGEDGSSMSLWNRLGRYYSDRGRFVLALGARQDQLKVARNHKLKSWEHDLHADIAALQSAIGDHTGASKSIQQMREIQKELRSSSDWNRNGNLWQAQAAWATGIFQGFSGHVAETEASNLACLGSITQYFGGKVRAESANAYYAVDCSASLMKTLLRQGRVAEAGAVAAQYRDFLDAYAKAQARPLLVSRTAVSYAGIAMEQGRFDEARKAIEDAIGQLLGARSGEGSATLAYLRSSLAVIEMIHGNWEKAEAIHRSRRSALTGGRESADAPLITSNWAYTLVRLGRSQEAADAMRRVVERQEQLFDENSLNLWDSRAFYGIALAAAGKRAEALKELSVAVPKVLELAHGERSSADAGIVRAKRLGWILDGYIALLSDIARTGEGAHFDAVNEAFRMADLARGSTVQRALAASASRANVSDPVLADLIRREQDQQREISAIADAIVNLLSRGRLAEQDNIVANMRANLEKLRKEEAQLLRELQRRFPDYASLVDPKPLGIAEIQKVLKPHEAMVAIYVGSDRTLVWAIPAQGKPVFEVAALDERGVAAMVKKLRQALDPAAGVPIYDFDTSYQLYKTLFEPVAAGWATAKELIVVSHGALASLPLAALTTAPFQPKEEGIAFSDYAAAPWLLKRAAISQLPAALAIAALRGRGQASRAPREFIGFGDPAFSAVPATAQPVASRSVTRRNLVINTTVTQKQDLAGQPDFSLLQPLPDTAEEIGEIAKVLKADTARDVFLQKNASEYNVKTQDISAYRVVMFATHGLVPGEMPGMYQPALALSNPALTGEKDDGFLTMEEILGLKLRADWVVLSACNTGSSSGQGSEAVSGLGRAFFYAGAKALLVSSWPVETVSARLLTTDMFRRQAEDPRVSRAGALRESSLHLMQQHDFSYSYAHPIFWAPFVVVGDGG